MFCSKKENAPSVQPGLSSSDGSPNSDAHIAFFPSKQSDLPTLHVIFPFTQNGKLLLGEPDEELEEKLLELNELNIFISQPDGKHLHLSGSSASHGKGQFLIEQPELPPVVELEDVEEVLDVDEVEEVEEVLEVELLLHLRGKH